MQAKCPRVTRSVFWLKTKAGKLADQTHQSPASVEDPSPTQKTCPICLSREACCAVVPCGHCACAQCLYDFICHGTNAEFPWQYKCPFCNGDLKDIIKLYFL